MSKRWEKGREGKEEEMWREVSRERKKENEKEKRIGWKGKEVRE